MASSKSVPVGGIHRRIVNNYKSEELLNVRQHSVASKNDRHTAEWLKTQNNLDDMKLGESASSHASSNSRSSSSSSRYSNKSKEAAIRQKMAELKLKQLQVQQTLEKQQQELKWRKDQLLVEQEVEQARMESELWKVETYEVKPELTFLPNRETVFNTETMVRHI